MRVKKQVHLRVQNLLNAEINSLISKISSNKWNFKKLEEEQTILKRELRELFNLRNSFLNKTHGKNHG